MDMRSAGDCIGESGSSDPHERRRYKRVVVEIPGKVFLPSTGQEDDCTIKNVSPAGAEIRCSLPAMLDTSIVVYAAGLGRFEGHVVWEIDGRRGVKFNGSEMKQARLASRLNGVERREQPRAKGNRAAQFTRDDGSVVPCTIRDFSTGGVLVESNIRPRVGEFILMGGMVGCVVRVDASGVGIEFVEREHNDDEFKRSLGSLDQWRTDDSR